MKFALVNDTYSTRPVWYVLIESYQDLMDWYSQQTLIKQGASDIIERIRYGLHASTPIGRLFEIGRLEGKEYRGDVFGFADFLTDTIFRQKVDALDKHGKILINSNGGYCQLIKDHHEITKIKEKEFLDFPDQELNIRFIQWKEGSHWYVKIGNIDVVVDGNQKWNTKAEAEQALERYQLEEEQK